MNRISVHSGSVVLFPSLVKCSSVAVCAAPRFVFAPPLASQFVVLHSFYIHAIIDCSNVRGRVSALCVSGVSPPPAPRQH